jgi:hypothetical protein
VGTDKNVGGQLESAPYLKCAGIDVQIEQQLSDALRINDAGKMNDRRFRG